MTLRAYLASKIPSLVMKTTVTDSDIQAVQATGIIHRWFVGADMGWGAIGSATPATTISGRTGKTCRDAQQKGSVEHFAPLWAMWLGAMLEARIGIPFITWLPFISYPGHLQGALDADLARQVGERLSWTCCLRPRQVSVPAVSATERTWKPR
jgi:hypothetical protein